MAQSDSLSVIIVTCNSEATIVACLQSIGPAAPGLSYEIIIVDNGSTDQTLALVAQTAPTATIIRHQTNLGFAAACNAGAAKATGGFLFFLNPDVVLDVGSLTALLSAMNRYQKVGLATMRLRFADGSFQANCRNYPTVTNLLFSRGSVMGRLLWEKISPKATVYTLPDYPEVTVVPAVSATAMAVRSELFRIMRGFDPRFFLYMEDTDLSYRAHLHRHQNLFVSEAGASHGWGRGSGGGKVFRAWHHHQSVWRYFLKHQATGFALIVLPAILLVNFFLVSLLPERRK